MPAEIIFYEDNEDGKCFVFDKVVKKWKQGKREDFPNVINLSGFQDLKLLDTPSMKDQIIIARLPNK